MSIKMTKPRGSRTKKWEVSIRVKDASPGDLPELEGREARGGGGEADEGHGRPRGDQSRHHRGDGGGEDLRLLHFLLTTIAQW